MEYWEEVTTHADQQGGDASARVQGQGFLSSADEHDDRIGSRRPRQPGAVPHGLPLGARAAYDRYAAVYDEVNAENDYEMWLGKVLLPELHRRGLQTGCALDLGCGTGRALPPLLDRGWEVVGCDVSAEMLARASEKFGGRVRLEQADVRCLPLIKHHPTSPPGGFELILLLNDVVNYLIDDKELAEAFAGVARNLSASGLVLFDVNTLGLFREDFTRGSVDAGHDWKWQGLSEDLQPGAIYTASLSGTEIEAHLHRQRHWTLAQISSALESAGLEATARLGQCESGGRVLLSERPDEARDRKIVYIAKRR